MPYGLWGRVKGKVGDFGLSARVDTSSKDTSALGLDLQAAAPSGTTLQVTAVADTASPSVTVGNVKVTQKIQTDAGDFVIAPKYNVGSGATDVSLSYGRDDTKVTIDANMDKQKITLSQGMGENNLIKPSITSEGDVELSYTRTIGPGALTANYKPDSHASLIYEDGPWVATVTAPIDGFYKPSESVKFNIRRSVDVTTLGI
uniref:Uncharacterized protein n=2 Tax=Amphora coffeiformis TaxID=265554 RepID=A0A7S3PD84_9STRA|eukprot:scaffold1037_cov157-Amphora_coffeaeformis.AAC.3